MKLQEKIMIVSLSISQWSARKYDRKVSYEIEKAHEAHDAGRFNKILIDADELKSIKRIKAKARNFHYFNTLPWGDNGDRVLPAANYFEYVQEFNKIKSEYVDAIETFIKDYEDMVEAAKQRLGRMFDPSDYPHSGLIRDKFGMRISFMPLPNVSDFRVDLQADEIDALKKQMQEEINSRVKESMADIITRAKELVQRMIDRLSEKDGIFRDSLVTNLEELVAVLPKLNFTGDKKLLALTDDLKSLCVNPDHLRTDPALRETTLKRANLIIKGM